MAKSSEEIVVLCEFFFFIINFSEMNFLMVI